MKKNIIDYKAAILSLSVHLLIILLCVFIGYTLPAQSSPIEEMGVEVNLGNSDEGSGIEQPFSTEHPAYQREQSSQQTEPNALSEKNNELLEDNTDPEATSVTQASKRINKIPNSATGQTNISTKPKVLFPAGNGKGGNAANINQLGGSEGNGSGTGDKGVPGGTPGASNYSGNPGNGTGGIGHSFTDRTIIAKPETNAEFSEGGKVVILVKVNREGFIIDKRIKKASSPELRQIALEKLNKVRFSKSETAPPEQVGDITFVFKTRAPK